MKLDPALVKRGITIAILAPLIFSMLHNPVSLTVLVWTGNFLSMVEWTAMKRHLKVALLDSEGTSAFAPPKDHIFSQPVAKTNAFILCKVFAGTIICPLTWFGSSYFYCGMTGYFFFWVIFTLMGQNKAESQVSDFLKKLEPSPATPTTRGAADQFVLHEMDVMTKRSQTDLMLSFALEYFGFVWTSGISYMMLLSHLHPTRGRHFLISLVVGNWANDFAALAVGRSMKGRTHPLYPRISPNKSTEGAVAGILSNALTVAGLMWYMSEDRWPFETFPLFFFIGVGMGTLGVVGDLLESLLKRAARIKDTGSMIRGHGGTLDRIDGMLLVFPISYWILWWILNVEGVLW